MIASLDPNRQPFIIHLLKEGPIMKKIGFFILGFILFLGPLNTAMGQQTPTICTIHPFTGRFAFAGIEGSAAQQDVVDMANEAGGINGKKIQYYWADGEYKDDVAIAAFKRLYAQYTPQIMFGQSTGMTKALGPEIKSRYKVLYSAYTMTSEAADPKGKSLPLSPLPPMRSSLVFY